MRITSIPPKKTLAYMSERIKLQKKLSYYHSDEYKKQQRKMLVKINEQKIKEDNDRKLLEIQKERLERNKPINKLKSVTRNALKCVDDIASLFVRIIEEEISSFCKDIKNEFKKGKI